MKKLRLVDLCAGLGGFHLGAHIFSHRSEVAAKIECVLASELDGNLRELYVRNFQKIDTSFEKCYKRHAPPADCAITPGLEDLYVEGKIERVHGTLETLVDPETLELRHWGKNTSRAGKRIIPEHDILCAGFPCQPFSKSGFQRGFQDGESGRGTVWNLIWAIIRACEPKYLLLENVGNFERHDGGRTWRTIRAQLEQKYEVRATAHVGSGNQWSGLLSPHHFGLPHHRERFFICAQHRELVGPFERSPFPRNFRSREDGNGKQLVMKAQAVKASRELEKIVTRGQSKLKTPGSCSAFLSESQVACIEHWQEFLNHITLLSGQIREDLGPMPSFPIWGFELDPWHHYPFEVIGEGPANCDVARLQRYRAAQLKRAKALDFLPPQTGSNRGQFGSYSRAENWIGHWPAYALRTEWPRWKVSFLRQNRGWSWQLADAFAMNSDLAWYRNWLDRLHEMPASFQKFEWNCQGEELELWNHILQLRPSGLRAKRFVHVPALVALTTTQVPIVPLFGNVDPLPFGARGRFLLAEEAARLQGFPADWNIPATKTRAFRALGNAVHAHLVSLIIAEWLGE